MTETIETIAITTVRPDGSTITETAEVSAIAKQELDLSSPKVTEAEISAIISNLLEVLGEGVRKRSGAGGNSPYSPETFAILAAGAQERGDRVKYAAVAHSHNGAGHYKGRGRTLTVVAITPSPEGEWAVCSAGDRGANEVGYSGVYLRPFATHEAEVNSKGMGGIGANALAAALAKLGLA